LGHADVQETTSKTTPNILDKAIWKFMVFTVVTQMHFSNAERGAEAVARPMEQYILMKFGGPDPFSTFSRYSTGCARSQFGGINTGPF